MSKNTHQSQPEASAPGNPSIQPAANNPARLDTQARINALLRHHMRMSEELCSEEHNVFWILDLEDKKAECIATAHVPPEKLIMLREEVKRSGSIPSVIMVSDLATLNTYRDLTNRPKVSPPPSGEHYFVVCSSGRFVVAQSNTRTSARLGQQLTPCHEN